jgi:class 3 adenylate cyclase
VLFQFAAYGGGTDSSERHQSREQLRGWAQTCPTLLRNEEDRLWFANLLRVGASPEIGYAIDGVDSVLATVLFIDLVGSSALAAELGDRGGPS